MAQPQFVIEASEAEAMAQSVGVPSVVQLLPTLVAAAQSLARAPISKFNVAAVGLGSDGRVYIGVNVEFPFLPLHHSIHAEQFLLTNLSFHNSPSLLAFAVSAAPCGHCRQFLQELRHSDSLQICITDTSLDFKPLIQLLPSPFGPLHLLDRRTPLLLELNNNGLMANGCHNKNEVLLIDEALKAANCSHAPYSGSPSGVALMDCNGKVYRGSYAESAAYNPSLGPLQAALVAFIAAGGGGYHNIVAALLVEKEDAIVAQEDTAKIILNKVAPQSDFKVIHCFQAQNGHKEG